MTSESSLDDAFWDIQLAPQQSTMSNSPLAFEDETLDSTTRFTSATTPTSRTKIYHIPCNQNVLQLPLKSLAESNGVFSPLGGQAWHGSAVLAALLLTFDDTNPWAKQVQFRITDRREESDCESNSYNVLELGSGAVGLSGIAVGFILADLFEQNETQRVSVVLSDADKEVLRQLQENVEGAVDQARAEYPDKTLPRLSVEHLDWNDRIVGYEDIDLIIGSELVYTNANARACFLTVSSLLEGNPKCLVVIVQTMDRQGWSDVFLRSLQEMADCLDYILLPLEESLHKSASNLLQRKCPDAHNRECLCALYIWNRKSPPHMVDTRSSP